MKAAAFCNVELPSPARCCFGDAPKVNLPLENRRVFWRQFDNKIVVILTARCPETHKPFYLSFEISQDEARSAALGTENAIAPALRVGGTFHALRRHPNFPVLENTLRASFEAEFLPTVTIRVRPDDAGFQVRFRGGQVAASVWLDLIQIESFLDQLRESIRHAEIYK